LRLQVRGLRRREAEGEVDGESSGVAPDGLVQTPGRHAVDARQIGVEDDALSAQDEDCGFEGGG